MDGRSECIGSGQEYTDPRGAFRTVERSALEVGSPVSFNVLIYKGAPCFEYFCCKVILRPAGALRRLRHSKMVFSQLPALSPDFGRANFLMPENLTRSLLAAYFGSSPSPISASRAKATFALAASICVGFGADLRFSRLRTGACAPTL